MLCCLLQTYRLILNHFTYPIVDHRFRKNLWQFLKKLHALINVFLLELRVPLLFLLKNLCYKYRTPVHSWRTTGERMSNIPNALCLDCEHRQCDLGKHTAFAITKTWVRILGLQFTGSVTTDKRFNLAGSQFPHL